MKDSYAAAVSFSVSVSFFLQHTKEQSIQRTNITEPKKKEADIHLMGCNSDY